MRCTPWIWPAFGLLLLAACQAPVAPVSPAPTVTLPPTASPALSSTRLPPTPSPTVSRTPDPTWTATPEPTLSPTPGWTRREPFENLFGVELAGFRISQGLDLFPARSLSATTWVRLAALSWRTVERVEGQYNWEAAGLEAQIQAAADRGLQIILVVREAPSWAAARSCGPVNPEKFPAFANFLAAAARHYPQVLYWELWNEPDIDFALNRDPNAYWGCWGDQADAYYGGGLYGEMLTVVYPALKAANPRAQLVGGALLLDCNPDDPLIGANCQAGKFLEGILRAGGGAALDGVSFHAYDYYASPGVYGSLFDSRSGWEKDGPVLVRKARYVKELLARYGLTGKFLMNTEAALLNDGACPAACQTARGWYITEAYAAALAEGLRANIWFRSLGWPGRNTALLRGSLTPYPAYYAYQAAAAQLRDAVYQGEAGGLGVAGYRFDRGDAHVWVVWSRDGQPHPLDLPAAPSAVTDAFGQPVDFSAGLMVNPAPVYIFLP